MTEKYENEAHQKPVGKMSPDEINIFLEKGYTLRLSCLKPNGDPFIVPCWHHWEKNNEKSTEEKIEGDFYVIPRAKSKWAEYNKVGFPNSAKNYLRVCIDKEVEKVRQAKLAKCLKENKKNICLASFSLD